MHRSRDRTSFRIAADMKLVAESTQTIPKSLIVASAQLRGHPDTRLELVWHPLPQVIRSIMTPSPVESCVPKRHHSLPTHVFTVRRLLP